MDFRNGPKRLQNLCSLHVSERSPTVATGSISNRDFSITALRILVRQSDDAYFFAPVYCVCVNLCSDRIDGKTAFRNVSKMPAGGPPPPPTDDHRRWEQAISQQNWSPGALDWTKRLPMARRRLTWVCKGQKKFHCAQQGSNLRGIGCQSILSRPP